jgi:hypothetical protein
MMNLKETQRFYLLNTQQYLRSGQTPEDLKEDLGINFKRHTKYPNLVSFKYNQIESPRNHPIVNECRGLILNEKDNWNVVSFPFYRFFNAEEGHAADIDWNTAVVQEKLDGCFSYDTVIRLWDGGTLTIGEIVNKKLSPTIFGYKNGKVVPSKVTGWHKNGTKNSWLRIVTASGRTLKCTDNHHIMLNGKFEPACLATPGDKMTRQIKSASDDFVFLVRAGLLGDGCLSKQSSALEDSFRYQESHKKDHDEYTLTVNSWLGDCAIKTGEITSGFGTKMTRVASTALKGLSFLREEWYASGEKQVPQDLSWVNDFVIAKWYMDDGSLAHDEGQQDRAYFATNSFNYNSCIRLASKLEEMYNVNCTVYNSKGWNIRVNAGRSQEIDSFWEAIEKHIVPCMRYKLPERYRDSKYQNSTFDCHTTWDIVDDKIISVEKLENTKSNFPAGRCGYDISTETENYFVKGLLVHNSLIIMYPYNGGWEVTTSGSADAGGNVGITSRTFREYFWDTVRDTLPVNWLENARQDHCYMFELMGPDNRIVVYHSEPHLKLLGCRNLKTLQEIPVKEAVKHFHGVEPVREFQLSSVDEIIATFETLSPTSQEGYVVVDASFNRIKIKSPAYVAIHHAKDGLSTKAFVEIARTGEVWEMIAHFPEYEEPLNEAKQRFSGLVKRLEDAYAKIADIENQKEFALANKCEVPGALFALRSGKVASIREFLCNMHIDKIMRLLGYKKRAVKHVEVTEEEIWE